MNLSDFILPTLEWNRNTWYGGHFYSRRNPSGHGSFWGSGSRRAHTGHDQAARRESPIRAPHAGEVVFVGWQNSGIGHAVIIRHPDVYIDIPNVGGAAYGEVHDVYSRQGHMAPDYWWNHKQFYVERGEWVDQGALLGRVGNSGASAGPHNHTSLTVGRPEHVRWQDDLHLDPELVYTLTSPYYYYANGGLSMEAVKGIQRVLQGDGFYAGAIDGIWGPMTEDAFERFADAALAATAPANLTYETVEVVREINLGE